MNHRLFPSSRMARASTTPGTFHSGATPYVDAHEAEVTALTGAGWQPTLPSGPTRARPTGDDLVWQRNRIFIDTDLDAVIYWNGADWLNVVSGLSADIEADDDRATQTDGDANVVAETVATDDGSASAEAVSDVRAAA